VGLEALRANPLRSVLSTLGVIIGVGALVSILALGDGLEEFSRSQIEQTTDLQSISVTSRTVDRERGIAVRRDSVASITAADLEELEHTLGESGVATLTLMTSHWIRPLHDTTRFASLAMATLPSAAEFSPVETAFGRFLIHADVRDDSLVAVVSHSMSTALSGDSTGNAAADAVLGENIELRGVSYRVVGVLESTGSGDSPQAFVPYSAGASARLTGDQQRFPDLLVKARSIEEVGEVRVMVEAWLEERYGSVEEYFTVSNPRQRLAQARQAMLVFKLAMGAITGISLLVGGIGIMNVLLASVNERTREIGIRRATGARSTEILIQFLSESVVVTGVGSILGVTLGMAVAFSATGLIRYLTEAQLYATFRWASVAIAVAAAVLVGLVFGIYPARKAAALSPIDAIRHE
jgi:putative ABC transport system permease protein